jgi:ferritin-like metal-binding protein YciE
MSRAEQKVLQYLNEAHASEVALTNVLQSQILMAPRGGYRTALETHLRETREHARRLQERASDLGSGGDIVQGAIGLIESAIGQTLALAKAPIDLIRGSGGEEKVLKNAKDACATEALEIATYTALERLANDVRDEQTARLAVSIRREEERMLERLMRELPRLADAVVQADVRGNGSYDISETGAADAVREAGEQVRRRARSANAKGRRTARKARRVPGVARAEGQVKGALASERDLPIRDYDRLSADEVVARLPDLSQVDLAKVESYERRNQGRTTVLSRLSTLERREPWPGYDEQKVEDIRNALNAGDERLAKTVRDYERSHKNRAGVIEAASREHAHA